MTIPVDMISFVALVAPGLLFELGLARTQNYLRAGLSDRLLRFGGWSLVWHALLLPSTIGLFSWLPGSVDLITNVQWLAVWAWALMVTIAPWWAGSKVGRLASKGDRSRLLSIVLGNAPGPRAWDETFSIAAQSGAWVRVRLRSGEWVAGGLGCASDEPNDLLLSPRLECQASDGSLELDGDGYPKPLAWHSLLRVEDLDRIEVQYHERD